jgi:hypothetical protein
MGEVIEVLAARALDLRQALDGALAEDVAYLILDGKVVGIDRRRGKRLETKVRGSICDMPTIPMMSREHPGVVTRAGYRCGPLMCFLGNVQFLTWLPPARTSWASDGRFCACLGAEGRGRRGAGYYCPCPQRAAPAGALLGRARLRTVGSARDSAQHVTASPARAVGVGYWVTDMQFRLGTSSPYRYPTGTVT